MKKHMAILLTAALFITMCFSTGVFADSKFSNTLGVFNESNAADPFGTGANNRITIIAGNAGTSAQASYDSEKKAVKIIKTEDLGSIGKEAGIAVRADGTCDASEEFVIKYDFMTETAARENEEPISLFGILFYNGGSIDEIVRQPALQAAWTDGTFGGNGKIVPGTWYTVTTKVNVNTGDITAVMLQSDNKALIGKVTGNMLDEESGYYVKKGLENWKRAMTTEIHAMAKGTFWVKNISYSTREALAVTSPAEGASMASSSKIQVTGTIPFDAESAELLFDGIKVSDISVGSDTFSSEIDPAGSANGRHIIEISAVVDGEKINAVRNIVFCGTKTVDAIEGMTQTARLDMNGTTGSKIDYFTTKVASASKVETEDGWVIQSNVASGSQLVPRVMFKGTGVTSGKIHYEVTFAADKLSGTWFQFSLNGQLDHRLVREGGLCKKGTTGSNGTAIGETLSDGEHTYGADIDLSSNTVTFTVDGEVKDSSWTMPWTFGAVTRIDMNLVASGSEARVITISDVKLAVMEDAARISGMSYEMNNNAVSEENWLNGKVSALADSVSTTFSEALNSDSVNDSNVKLYTVSGETDTELESVCELSENGMTVTVAPTGGFDKDSDYIVKFVGVATALGDSIGDTETRFVTNSDVPDGVEVEVFYENGIAKAVFTICRTPFSSEIPSKSMLMLALYSKDGKRLKGIKIQRFSANIGENVKALEMEAEEGDKVKGFVWTDSENVVPIYPF